MRHGKANLSHEHVGMDIMLDDGNVVSMDVDLDEDSKSLASNLALEHNLAGQQQDALQKFVKKQLNKAAAQVDWRLLSPEQIVARLVSLSVGVILD
jgi:hypothetical protein